MLLLKEGPCLFQSNRETQKAREVRQQFWACSVEISDGSKTGRITVTCVVAREIGAAKNIKSVKWRFLTNRQIFGVEEVIERINWYRSRWKIEIYSHVLKNGCEVEALQLSAVD